MQALIYSLDWSKTSIGPRDSWSPTLNTLVKLVLTNRFPLLLWWGPKFLQIYNDPYRPVLGTKHPESLGQPASECWPEIWSIIGPLIETPFQGGPATWVEDLELEINVHGFTEESHFSVAYSPVPDEMAAGGIGGVLATVHDISAKVIGDRRVVVLRDLGVRSAEAKSADEACRIAAETLGHHPKDIPFALLYLLDDSGQQVHLAGSSGTNMAADPNGTVRSITAVDWPWQQAAVTESIILVDNIVEKFTVVPRGPWADPPHCAAVVPVRSNVAHQLAGFLVLGVSSRIQFDDRYRGFFDLVASQVATAIANAKAFEIERKRAEALAELDRAKTAFFSNVSHEFRTPLTLALSPLQEVLSSSDGNLDPGARELLRMAHRNALRLEKLVNTLLDFARIEARRVQASYEPVDVAALTAELASSFRSAIEKAGLRLVVDCPPLPEAVYVDLEMWEKIVLNFLSNAFKFTLQGTIAVSLKQSGDAVQFSISDTGIGIPEEDLPRIFERFYRVEGARGRSVEGTGIGLALVNELVRLHGGATRVASRPGEGSTFTVTIPLGTAHLPHDRIRAERQLAPTAVHPEAYVEEALSWLPDETARQPSEFRLASVSFPSRTGSHRRARILLVDDNADMRDYIRRLLDGEYEVHALANGREALDRALKNPPDMVLSDIMMPELDGFQLLQALRAEPRTKTLPVILLSARAGEESRIEGLQRGADDYITKPFTAREFLARVGAHLELFRVRQEAAEALRQSEERFRALVTANSNVVYRMSPDWREMLELRGGDFIADTERPSETWIDKYIHPDDQTHVLDAIGQAIRTKSIFQLEHRVLRIDGTLGWTFSRAVPLLDEVGEIREWFGVALDISERKLSEERMRDTQKLESIGILAGGIAHDFNNLLVGVLGNASLAHTLVRDDSEIAALLNDIEKASERAAHLTRQLLAYAGKGRFVVEPVNLSQLVREMTGLLSIPKKVRLLLELAPNLPAIQADAGQLQQVVMNLVINAAEAIGDDAGLVSIQTLLRDFTEQDIRRELPHAQIEPGKYVALAVTDNGCGMDEQTQARVFDPFFTTKFTGRGLGLAAVAGIVRGHKGAIKIRSSPGAGSTFLAQFPAATGGAAVPDAPRQPTHEELRGTGSVLVVDDESVVLRVAKAVLEQNGYTALMASGGEEAVEILRRERNRISLVVLDLSMPDMSGHDVLPRLRAVDPRIKVVISSGYSETETMRLFAGQSLSGFIQKPYTGVQLARKVKEAIGCL
jgi:signal transduction histidine kinase